MADKTISPPFFPLRPKKGLEYLSLRWKEEGKKMRSCFIGSSLFFVLGGFFFFFFFFFSVTPSFSLLDTVRQYL